MSKANIRATINAHIKQNGNQEITGQILNSVLNTMVDDYAEQEKLTDLQTIVDSKQDTIADLDAIRQGAAKGSTALQSESDPVYLADKPKLALKVEIPDVSGKVDKVTGKGLSSNDYTDADKLKLAGLENYDDTQVRELIAGKQDTIADLEAIREGAELGKTSLQEHQDISGLATKKEVATKQDTISDLESIREGAALGKTALQSYIESDPIYTADKPNLALKSELNGKQDKLTAGDNITIVDNVISSTGGGGGSVDLSAYAKTVDVNAGLATKQDILIAGNGIIIEQNVISATGGSGGGGSVDLSEYAKTVDVNAGLATKQDKISDLDDIREGAAKGATALQSETDPIYSADKPSLALKSELNGKQDTISDLESIREGAALGKTSLQEHQDISKLATKEEVATKQDKISDLATIREGAAKGATALQSYTETDPIYIADKPSIAFKRDIPDISGKADKTAIVTETAGNSSYRIAPNRLTRLGTLASNVTLSLNTASEEAGVVNVYDIIFTTPATNAPSITWPEGITWAGGSAPAIAGGKTYEVSIMDGLATYGEFSV